MAGYFRVYAATFVKTTDPVAESAAYSQFDLNAANAILLAQVAVTSGQDYVFSCVPNGERIPRAVLIRIRWRMNPLTAVTTLEIQPVSFTHGAQPSSFGQKNQNGTSITDGETVRVLDCDPSNGNIEIVTIFASGFGGTYDLEVSRLALLN